MPLSDHYRGGQTERMVVTITTVDPASEKIEGIGRDGAVIQISAGHVSGFFRMPIEHEQWVVVRENGIWQLESVIEVSEWVKKKNDLLTGQALITANEAYLATGHKLVKDSELIPFDTRLDNAEGRLDDAEDRLDTDDSLLTTLDTRLDSIEGRYYNRQTSLSDHVDGSAGWQPIQGFTDITIPVTNVGASYRCIFQARTFQSNTGFNQEFGFSFDGATPGPGEKITIGYGGSGNIPLYLSFDKEFSVGSHTVRPWVNHSAGSGFLTIFAGKYFLVDQIR